MKNDIDQNIDMINKNVDDIKIIVSTLGIKIVKKEDIKNTKDTTVSTEDLKDKKIPLMANMFLNSQKQKKEQISLEQISKAKHNIVQKKTVESVKQSAAMLELDPENIEFEHKDVKGEKLDKPAIKKAHQVKLSNNNILNKMLLDNKISLAKEQIDLEKQQVDLIKSKASLTNINYEKDKEINKTIEIQQTVPIAIVETIQNKIVGAQQKIGSFMSEVARNMYLNYKPPVTAFRMNLNPANLGSISVVIKANKADSTVSVKMNMNNNSTLDLFVDNKNALYTALQKQLGDSSNVSLNFDMQDGKSEQNFDQAKKDSQKQSQNKQTGSIEDINEDEIEVEQVKEHY